MYTRFSKVSFALNGQFIEFLISQHRSIKNMPFPSKIWPFRGSSSCRTKHA